MLWANVSAFVRSQTPSSDMKISLDYFLDESRMLRNVLLIDPMVALVDTGLTHEYDIAVISSELEVKSHVLQAAKKLKPPQDKIYPTIEFQDIDILRFRSAWAKLDLERNRDFGSAGDASDHFVYRVGGIRTGDPLVPRNDIADDLDIEPTAASTLLEALTEFFSYLLNTNACLAPDRDPTEQTVKDRVGLEVDCCYLHGRLGDYFKDAEPGLRQPGAEMGKLAKLRADPATCANETATLVRTWLNNKSVPKADEGGWKGKLRLDVALFNEGDDNTNMSSRPFLRIRRCLLPLKDLKQD
jgi:hypothetical protein